MHNDLRNAFQPLYNGGWEGKGSKSFFIEMENIIFPTLVRLNNALTEAQAVSLHIKSIFIEAEKEAALLFKDNGAIPVSIPTPTPPPTPTVVEITPTPTSIDFSRPQNHTEPNGAWELSARVGGGLDFGIRVYIRDNGGIDAHFDFGGGFVDAIEGQIKRIENAPSVKPPRSMEFTIIGVSGHLIEGGTFDVKWTAKPDPHKPYSYIHEVKPFFEIPIIEPNGKLVTIDSDGNMGSSIGEHVEVLTVRIKDLGSWQIVAPPNQQEKINK